MRPWVKPKKSVGGNEKVLWTNEKVFGSERDRFARAEVASLGEINGRR